MPTPLVGTLPLDGFLFLLGYSYSKVWLAFTLSIEQEDCLVELSWHDYTNYCCLLVIFYLQVVHHIAMMPIASTFWKGIVESFGSTFLLVCVHFFHYCFCNKTSKSLW
jgi:hypothetical protein